MSKGIDVSTWQGSIDFSRVKASGIDFVIIRAGYGSLLSQKDKWFEQNYARAKAAGLHVGAYWYSYAGSAAQARQEAKVCKQVLLGKQFDYPVYFDLEEKSQLSKGRAFCDSLVTAFCTEMEAGGYFAGFYTSASVAANILSPSIRKRFAFWCAQWASRNSFEGASGLWQYSSNGSVPGISGRVDMDISYIDYPSIIKKGGFNGYPKGTENKPVPAPKTEKKSVDTLAKEVIKGLWGNGADRKDRLTKAGYSYDAVQKRVNELLGAKPQKKSIDTIARKVIRGDWGNGAERKNRLTKAGYDYNAVQKRVNELLK